MNIECRTRVCTPRPAMQQHHRRSDSLEQSIYPARWVGGSSMVWCVSECVHASVRKCCVGQCPTVQCSRIAGRTKRNASFPSLYRDIPACPSPSTSPVPVSGCHNYATRGGQLRRRGDRLRWKHVVRPRRMGETLNKQGTLSLESRTTRHGPGVVFGRKGLTPCRSRVCRKTHVDGEDDGDGADARAFTTMP